MKKQTILHIVMYGVLVLALLGSTANYSLLHGQNTALLEYSKALEKINISYSGAYNNMLELKNLSLKLPYVKTQSELQEIEQQIIDAGEKAKKYNEEISQLENEVKTKGNITRESYGYESVK